jgi:Tol biopolymer transport system component
MIKKFTILFVFVLLAKYTSAQISYPDNNLPTNIPQVFAKGLLSDGQGNRDFSISPAGDIIFYTIQLPRWLSSTIIQVVKKNGKWGKPEVAPFSGVYHDLEATFSPDGKTVFFSSDRPTRANEDKKDFDIWKISRLDNGSWGVPEHLGNVVNTAKNEFYPSVTKNGDLYFTVEADYGKGKEDIVMCKWTKDGYNAPVSLPEAVNSPGYEFNAFVDPDEQFIIFTGYGRADDMGGGDLYISRKDGAGNWQPAHHLPPGINSSAIDYCPYVTADKKYLIFTSSRVNPAFADEKRKDYKQLSEMLNGPGNGWDDIYWVKYDANW